MSWNVYCCNVRNKIIETIKQLQAKPKDQQINGDRKKKN